MPNRLIYSPQVTVQLNAPYVSGSTSITVFPINNTILSGTTLTFLGGGLAFPATLTVTADAPAPVTTINVASASVTIPVFAVAYVDVLDFPIIPMDLVEPEWVFKNRRRFRRVMLPLVDRANSFYETAGFWPSRGWVLVRFGDFNRIDKFATNFTLEIDDLTGPENRIALHNLSIVQAQCVTAGVQDDPEAIYLVELTDGRGVLYNSWFQFPTGSQYNVRAPAYPQQYYDISVDPFTLSPFTWQGIVTDFWGQMAQYLGKFPGMPAVVSGVPENFSFTGFSAWESFNKVLKLIGMNVIVDLRGTYPNCFGLVSPGDQAAAQGFLSLQGLVQGLLEDDMRWSDVGAARVPRFMTIYFNRRNDQYGTEETVRPDLFQWQSEPFFSTTIDVWQEFGDLLPNLSAAFGQGYLWDDFTVRADVDGNPLASDVALARVLAVERIGQYFNDIYRGTFGYMRQIYAGTIPFSTGSLCDGVRWYQTYSLLDPHSQNKGWRTEIIRGFMWDEVKFKKDFTGLIKPT